MKVFWLILILASVLIVAIAPLRAMLAFVITKIFGPSAWNLTLVFSKHVYMIFKTTLRWHLVWLRNLTRPHRTIYPSLDDQDNP